MGSMSHSHDHSSHPDNHTHAHEKDGHSHRPRQSKILWAIGITGSILVLEAVGGVISGSLALLSDAGHMLTDLAALLISLAAMMMAERPASSQHTYGWARLEVLAALGNSITFFLMVAGVGWEALHRLSNASLPDWKTMGIIAGVGLLANALSAWFLHGSHEEDLNMQSAWIHVLGDLASSFGVLIGVAVIAETGWVWVDPILSLGIAILIGWSAIKLFRKALRILLESAPQGITSETLRADLLKEIPEIKEIHHVHLWEVGSGEIHLTAHLVVEDQPLSRVQEILRKAAHRLEEHQGIRHSTLQMETMIRVPIQGPAQ
jgi:cobalt-zinc-cadmium efflux system protein